MKVDTCSVCGQYHSADECEATDEINEAFSNFQKLKKQKKLDTQPGRDKEKSYRRPPVDKMIKWEYTK